MSVTLERKNVTGSMSRSTAAALLLLDDVTDDITETGCAEETISVMEAATETPEKSKRGRPPKSGSAMTAAERSRRYRRKNVGLRRRIELWSSTVERAEKLAAETGDSAALVIEFALAEVPDQFWVEMKASRLQYDAEHAKRIAATDA